ncbi:MAG TPA: universal stress protein [Sphingopyxis sp.]|uniref:universal stress protein n=1 Tax=Sphingopyxis sp. TaxID=1908224 RepID=UPI002C6D6BA9|nr:universal stress protein [Sphingopyxis sp.]HWW56018.1 universal stress protein [Sphingopyxis sp.]
MYKHILIATDGSELGQRGMEHGLSLARDLNARATILTVTEPFPIYSGANFGFAPSGATISDFGAGQQETAKALLAAAGQAARSAGVEAETVYIADAQPAEAIVDAANSRGCDLIVMGSHGRRGIGRIVIGSKTWEVVSHGHVPVLVVR